MYKSNKTITLEFLEEMSPHWYSTIELSNHLDIVRQVIYYVLSELVVEGLVEKRKDGKQCNWRLKTKGYPK